MAPSRKGKSESATEAPDAVRRAVEAMRLFRSGNTSQAKADLERLIAEDPSGAAYLAMAKLIMASAVQTYSKVSCWGSRKKKK